MTIFALGSSGAELGGGTTTDTTAGRFDAAYSTECALANLNNPVYNNGNVDCIFALDNGAAVTTDMWIHFHAVFYLAGLINNGGTGKWFSFTNAANQEIASCTVTASGANRVLTFNAIGDTTVAATTTLVLPATGSYDFDLHVTAGTSIVLEVYQNGTLLTSATAANTGAKGKPQKCTFLHHYMIFTSANDNSYIAFSEVIGTDGEPTIGWRIAALKPAADGFYTQWTNGYAGLADANGASGIYTTAAANRQSFTLSAYGGTTTPASIRGLAIATQAQAGASAPQHITPFARIASTNYDQTSVVPGVGKQIITDMPNNPATAAPWTIANLTGLELGYLSAA